MDSKIQLPRNIRKCPFDNAVDTKVICVCWANKNTKELFGYQYICYPTKFCKGNGASDCDNCRKEQCKGR